MKLVGSLHHVAIPTQDLEKSLAFYQDFLGLKLITTQRDTQNQARSCWLDMAGTILMLERTPESQGHKVSGFVLAFQILAAERTAWQHHLAKHRIAIHKQSDFSLYFHDPDGHLVALSHYPQKKAIT